MSESISDELDEILGAYNNQVASASPDFFYTKRLKFLREDEAKQAILNLINEARNAPTYIMGKPIDEVCGILSMLEMERLAEMQLTMKNLKEWQKLLAKEQKEIFEKTLDRQLATLKSKEGKDE